MPNGLVETEPCTLTPEELLCPCKQPHYKQKCSPHNLGKHSLGMVLIRAAIY